MEILLIGNGFDLEHDLPTHYKDFLDFVTKQEEFILFMTTYYYVNINKKILIIGKSIHILRKFC